MALVRVMLATLTTSSLSFAAESKSTAADAEFMKMDTNKDGKVTATEMQAAHQRVTGRNVKKSDMTAAEKIKVVDEDGH